MIEHPLHIYQSILPTLLPATIQYALIGGCARSVHGNPRGTRDLDISVIADAENYKELKEALEQNDFKLNVFGDIDGVPETLFARKPDLPRLDILFAHTSLGLNAVKNAVYHDGISIPVARVEELIAMKLVAGRTRDLADVEDLLSEVGIKTLDMELIKGYAREWQVDDRLQQCLQAIS